MTFPTRCSVVCPILNPFPVGSLAALWDWLNALAAAFPWPSDKCSKSAKCFEILLRKQESTPYMIQTFWGAGF